MLKIRFLRKGKRHQPFFYIVVTEKNTSPKSGKYVEKVGFYNPLRKDIELKKERILYWLSQGAKPSDSVHNLLIKKRIIKGKKIDVHKEAKKKDEEEKDKKEKIEKGEAEVKEKENKEEKKEENKENKKEEENKEKEDKNEEKEKQEPSENNKNKK